MIKKIIRKIKRIVNGEEVEVEEEVDEHNVPLESNLVSGDY